ncbi:hypothetical protein CBL_01347 [Carabus blaptoides fortunei]
MPVKTGADDVNATIDTLLDSKFMINVEYPSVVNAIFRQMKNVAETVNSHKCVLGATRIIDRMQNGCLRAVDVSTTYLTYSSPPPNRTLRNGNTRFSVDIRQI